MILIIDIILSYYDFSFQTESIKISFYLMRQIRFLASFFSF